MPEQVVLGLDIGTSSTKAVLVGEHGRIVAQAQRAHQTAQPHAGWFEHDAETVWWADSEALIRELTAVEVDIAAVCVSGLGPCVLVADEAARPLRPAMLYGVDTRAVSEIEEMTNEFGGANIVDRCGSRLSTQAAGPKLRWLKHHEPHVYDKAHHLFTASSFIVHRLTGEYVLDHHTASQFDPLYDLSTGTWIEPWWSATCPNIIRPRLAWPAEVVGAITPVTSAQTGLRAGTPVTAGTVDAWAEQVSVGAGQVGDLLLMYGTTMFLIASPPHLVRHPALWSTTGVDEGSFSLSGGMATSGAITTWLADLTSAPIGELFTEAAAVPAGARGLLTLPYFAGERTPIADPLARGVIVGLTLQHTRGDMLRSMLEATAFGVRHNLEAFAESGARSDRVVAVGGGTHGGLWPQIVSDVIGRTQQVPAITIGASYGDALLAARAVGLETGSWVEIDHEVVPDPAQTALYETRYRSYRDLYEATRHVVHGLAEKESPGQNKF